MVGSAEVLKKSRLKQNAPSLTWKVLRATSLVGIAWAGPASASASWTTIATRAFPLQQSDVTRFISESKPVHVVVVLHTRQTEALSLEVQRRVRTGGQQHSPSQSISPFLPTVEQVKVVSDYLVQSGFTDVKIADDRLLVSATGSSSAVRQAFKTELVDVNRNGTLGIANVSDVQLPSNVATLVLSVLGLQTLVHPHPLFVPSVSPQATAGSFNPTAFPAIYGASALPPATGTTVGIVADGVLTGC